MLHRNLYNKNIFPNPDLFFGFEDLEYGLRVKDKGFQLFVSGVEVLRLRNLSSKYGKDKPRSLKKNPNTLCREYYSIRELSSIGFNEINLKIILIFTVKIILKIILAFRYGFKYGYLNAYFVLLGYKDGKRGLLGL